MADGPLRGLQLLDQSDLETSLGEYYLYHAARADLLRRAVRHADAATAYRQALALCHNQVERRYLERRLAQVG
jgi:RNA polymerase sigma-70 factor, ECF subfamily